MPRAPACGRSPRRRCRPRHAGSKDAAEALAAETGAETIRTDSADRDALLTTVASRGALDVLVASAGTLVLGDPLTLDADAIDNMIDVNVRAPVTPRSRLRAR